MKRIAILALALLLMCFTNLNTELTGEERTAATEKLTQTRSLLLKSLVGLSETQLNYKKDSQSWSIAECIEHIAITEESTSTLLKSLLKEKADPANRTTVALTDDELIALVTDRSRKVKTREAFEPSNKYGSHDATLQAFLQKRAAHIRMVKTSNEDFRNRVTEFPFGMADAYQVILFMAAHSERHRLQIEEIKANANFPKS